MKKLLLVLLFAFSLSVSQQYTISKFQGTGTTYIRLKVPESKEIFTCFEPATYSSCLEAKMNYFTLDSLYNIKKEQLNICKRNDSLGTVNEDKLKTQNTGIINKLDTATALYANEKPKKWIWSGFSLIGGFCIGVITFAFVSR